MPLKKKGLNRKKLIKQLDSIFSWYIRIKNSVNGDATCVTCGKTDAWGKMQNGHFFTRGRFPTRWDEMNCNVQCPACNLFLHGNYIIYTKYMLDRYGREKVDELERKSLSGVKIPTVGLPDLISHYQSRVDKMLAGQDKTESSAIDKIEWGVVQ